MARRNRENTDTTTTTEELEVTVTEEPTVEVSTEAEAAPAEATEVDLTAFNAAVSEAIDNHDNATGTVPEQYVGPVTAAYRALDGLKAKNAARKVIEVAMKDAMSSMDIGLARAYMVLSDTALVAGPAAKKEREEKPPADPTEAFVQRVAGLDLARALVVVPEGVAADWQDRVAALVSDVRAQADSLLAYLDSDDENKGEEPEVPAWVKAAVKLSRSKTGRATGATKPRGERSGVRRDIGEHIRQAFEGQESGAYLSVSDLRKFQSTEYGDEQPSAGAISARLFPPNGRTCTLDFVTPATAPDGSSKGATKN